MAAPAGAQGCRTLSLSGASSGTVGTPYAITRSGTDVPADEGPYHLEIDAIPGSFTTTCPTGYLNGGQVAASSGGSFVAFDEPENVDSSGNFSNPKGFTAKTAGSVLVCGYTDDGAGDTLAIASQIVDFQSPSTGGGGGGSSGGGGGGQTGQGAVKPANTTSRASRGRATGSVARPEPGPTRPLGSLTTGSLAGSQRQARGARRSP